MARFRLSGLARGDIARILGTSAERWGTEARRRYAVVLAAAMRKVAVDPEGPTTRGRPDLLPGIRSFHIRHAASRDVEARVSRPVHILYYRVITPGLIEIVRVLHDRMDPAKHLPS
jgi:toxin ParE1/3/4